MKKFCNIIILIFLLTFTALSAQEVKLKKEIVYVDNTEAFSFIKKGMGNELYVYKLNTKEELVSYIQNFISKNEDEILKKPKLPSLLSKLKDGMKFADTKEVLSIYDDLCKKITPKNETSVPEPKNDKSHKNKESDAQNEEKELLKKYKTEKLVARDLGASLNDPRSTQSS